MRRDELRVHTYSNNLILLQPLEHSTRTVDNTVHRLGHCTVWTAPVIVHRPNTSTPKQYHLLAHERANCVRHTADGTDAELDICNHCSGSLARGNVPPRSYKSVDNGPRPAHLPQLTLLEERVVAPARVLRHLLLCRHAGERHAAYPSSSVARLRAHIISFNNPGPDELAAMFPCRPEDLPELIQVVLVAAAQTEQEVIELARCTPALHVRGHVIAAWARHLAAVYPELTGRLDHAALQQWEHSGDCIPRDLLATAMHVDTQEEADAIAQHMQQRQAGYARARYGGPEEAAAHGVAAPPAAAAAAAAPEQAGDDEAAAIHYADAAAGIPPAGHEGAGLSAPANQPADRASVSAVPEVPTTRATGCYHALCCCIALYIPLLACATYQCPFLPRSHTSAACTHRQGEPGGRAAPPIPRTPHICGRAPAQPQVHGRRSRAVP